MKENNFNVKFIHQNLPVKDCVRVNGKSLVDLLFLGVSLEHTSILNKVLDQALNTYKKEEEILTIAILDLLSRESLSPSSLTMCLFQLSVRLIKECEPFRVGLMFELMIDDALSFTEWAEAKMNAMKFPYTTKQYDQKLINMIGLFAFLNAIHITQYMKSEQKTENQIDFQTRLGGIIIN